MVGPITALLQGQQFTNPPLWLMRQAGRYLAEYRAVRAKAGSFLNLCFTPEWAVEVTLQPLRRFDLSAAIIFSDILVIPFALGMDLSFVEGEGPRLNPDQLPAIIARGFDPEVKAAMLARLAPVFTAITATRQSLPTNKDLIGFAGAPFTLACYMIEGRSVPGFPRTLAWAQAQPAPFARLMDILTQAVISFLQAQKKSGADIVKIFDSWSALIPHDLHEVALYAPHRLIVATPNLTPLITFPKGFPHGHTDLVAYQQQTQARIIAIDHHRPMAEVAQQLPKDIILQGNLDPQLLRIGGAAMKQAVEQQLDTMAQLASPYIFNLGHGIDKTTPPDHVAQLINIIQQYQPTS